MSQGHLDSQPWSVLDSTAGHNGRKRLNALMRSNALPLIRTLLDHRPRNPHTVARHELSLQHLRFMLTLYRRSADGNGRPMVGKLAAGAAVRLVRPLAVASFITGPWLIQNLTFSLHSVNAEELKRATMMHPQALYLENRYYVCKVYIMPNGGLLPKVRVLPGMRLWAETEMTSQVKPLADHSSPDIQIQMSCKHTKKRPIDMVAASPAHIPFLLIYFNHNAPNFKENMKPDKSEIDILRRKPRQADTIGHKLPKIPNESVQSKKHCSLHPLWVSFHQLGWDHWIIAPHRYNPGYCKGDCPRLLHSGYNSPNHAIIQNFINQVVDVNVPRPSCVPYSYGPISVLMIETGGNILYKEYENMMAKSCTCR
ncbi:bone morphogenetic protein 15 [Gastrophryne carolinensis]